MISCIHVRLTRELYILLSEFRIRPGKIEACHSDKEAQAAHDSAIMFVEIGLRGHIAIVLWQSCVWFQFWAIIVAG